MRSRIAWLPRLQPSARRAMAVIAGVGTIVAVATAVIELRDRLQSNGTPITATIAPVERYEPDVALSAFRASHPEIRFAPDSVEQLGVVFTCALTLRGLRGETAVLRWRVLDGGGAEVGMPEWVPRRLGIEPDQDEFSVTAEIWSPLPAEVERFALEFSVDDHNGVRRAVAVGPTVRVGRF